MVEKLVMLRQYLDQFISFLVMTGVGGLPLPPLPIPRPEHTILTPIAMEQGPMKMPPESELADQTAAGIGVLYARQTRVRENSAAVAGLLAASL